MSKWGADYDETFVVTTLTADFDDNVRLGNVPDVIQAFVYIDYTKGSETSLEIRIEESMIDDDNPTTELYFGETIADNNGDVEQFVLRLYASGNYRLPLQIGKAEDRIRVAVRGAGTPPFSGTATLYYGVR